MLWTNNFNTKNIDSIVQTAIKDQILSLKRLNKDYNEVKIDC